MSEPERIKLAALLSEWFDTCDPAIDGSDELANWLHARGVRAVAAGAGDPRAAVVDAAREFIVSAIGNLAEQRWETVELELGAALGSLTGLRAGAPGALPEVTEDDDQRRLSPSPVTLSAEAGARLRGELASGLTVARLAALLRETIILCAPSDVERVDFEVTAKRLLPQLAMSRGAPTPAMIAAGMAAWQAYNETGNASLKSAVEVVLRAALTAQEQP